MKSASLHVIVALLALSFILGCGNKPATTDNAAAGSASPAATGASSSGSGTDTADAKSGKPAPSETLVIPSGKVISVRFGETLTSGKSSEGQDFSATVAEPVVVGGRTVIARGA